MELADRKYMDEDGFVSATAQKACSLIMKNISLKIAAMIPDDEGPEVMWDWLKSQYGADDTFLLKKNLKNIKMNNLDLDEFWGKYNMALAVYKSAGGKISYEDQLDICWKILMSNFSWMLFEKFDWKQREWKSTQKRFFTRKMQSRIFTTQHPKKFETISKNSN